MVYSAETIRFSQTQRDVSNKNESDEIVKKNTRPLGIDETSNLVAHTREREIGSQVVDGERVIPPIRTSSRFRAKVDHTTNEETTKTDSKFAAAAPQRGNRSAHDETKCHGTLSKVNSKEDKSYECVHPDYRLERPSFDGQTHTLGIAAHDKRNKNDVLNVIPYISDIFQNFFSNEVRYFF